MSAVISGFIKNRNIANTACDVFISDNHDNGSLFFPFCIYELANFQSRFYPYDISRRYDQREF